MVSKDIPKKLCRTPTPGRSGETSIPLWKYEAVRIAILAAIRADNDIKKGGSIGFNDLREKAKAHMQEAMLARLGSWGWHFTTVKLNMEVEGEIKRLPGSTPQQLVLGL